MGEEKVDGSGIGLLLYVFVTVVKTFATSSSHTVKKVATASVPPLKSHLEVHIA